MGVFENQVTGGVTGHQALPVRSLGLRPLIEHTVTFVFAIERGDLHVASRGRANVALARQTAMYLAHVGFRMTLTDVGMLFQRDRTTVAHACCVIEDRRDDPNFDRVMDLLERALRALRTPRADGSNTFP
jgi:hypothetical protein